ncbi:hypothetical protein BC834DRAFT_974606 [Gloeopeniophorella convolvens]|nr:hypothetical protein BC834DRAFT_974606 [Gloeopeniophorella convolvens]
MPPFKPSSKPSPLAALAPLHALVQVISAPQEGDRRFILLTSLTSDAWLVRVGLSDGCWWGGSWRAEDLDKLAGGDTSAPRLGAFAQRVARTIVRREVVVVYGKKFEDMKLVLGTTAKKPLQIALNTVNPKDAASFAFQYLEEIANAAQAHGCRALRGPQRGSSQTQATDAEPESQLPPVPVSPSKRRRIKSSVPAETSPNSSRASSPTPLRPSRRLYNAGDATSFNDDGPSPTTSPPASSPPHKESRYASGGKSKGKGRALPEYMQTPAERAALAEVETLRAELARARADAAAAIALAAEREPVGLGGSVDRLRSRSAIPAMPRRPGASLANPSKAARRLVAIEFASDSED